MASFNIFRLRVALVVLLLVGIARASDLTGDSCSSDPGCARTEVAAGAMGKSHGGSGEMALKDCPCSAQNGENEKVWVMIGKTVVFFVAAIIYIGLIIMFIALGAVYVFIRLTLYLIVKFAFGMDAYTF